MRNKRKGILMASAILGSAAIVSTGFAAWVITVEDTEVATGNIEVDKVEDKSHIITMDAGNDLTVKYGMGGTTTNPNPWLTNDGTLPEDFSVTCNFTVTNPQSCDFNDVSITYTGAENAKTAFQSAIDKGYIATPTVELDLADDFYTTTAKVGQGSLVFTFGWGDYFEVGEENVNPYVFFNSKTATEKVGGSEANKDNTWAAEAVAVLGVIAAAEGVGFQVTLQTKAKASS